MPVLPGGSSLSGSLFAWASEANATHKTPSARVDLALRRIVRRTFPIMPSAKLAKGFVIGFVASAGFALSAEAVEPVKLQRLKTPSPPWPAGDERGMANQIGPATWARCAFHLSEPGAKGYEVSHPRSNTMPLSPFAGPYAVKPKGTAGIPGTAHAFNSETMNEGAEPAQQGTQMDALGHFASLKQPWDGKESFPSDRAAYY